MRCVRGSVLDTVIRGRRRTAVSALLVSGVEHAPQTYCPSAHVPAQEEDRDQGRTRDGAAQVLSKVRALNKQKRSRFSVV